MSDFPPMVLREPSIGHVSCMSFFRNREQEKQRSRDEDQRALASGEKTREQLREENTKLRITKIDFTRVRAPR